jgi:hypothetical protein
METAMPTLTIEANWERTDAGDPEERACFALFKIASGPVILTEGYDEYVRRLREGPLVSAYHAAEWFAWNWWRLRWEPRTKRPDWPFAHQMSAIGQGYVWPNITIWSDGERTSLIAKPSTRPDAKPFRYITDRVLVVGAPQFEAAVDSFITQVLDRLTEEGLGETNLSRLWRDVSSERADPTVALRRKLEALSGADPDEANDTLNQLIADAQEIGNEATAELAADEGMTGGRHTVASLRAQARDLGHDARLKDAVSLLNVGDLPRIGEVAAWKRGAEAARLLRKQEHLGAAPISNHRLETMTGVGDNVILGHQKEGADISFALDEQGASRLVLRPKWETGRRFELARLLGDRVAAPNEDKLKPATRSYTYRQKMQRSFAAELLCPFEAVADMLHGDFSDESIEGAARHFTVSERAVRTLLVNHGCLDREDLDQEFEMAAA